MSKLTKNTRSSCSRQFRITQLIVLAVVVTTVVCLFLKIESSEQKKIKIKDLKKAKKFAALLLLPQKKKMYALPFPVPLPIIVKRQNVYHQIPVVHKQIDRPYPAETIYVPEPYEEPYDANQNYGYSDSKPKQEQGEYYNYGGGKEANKYQNKNGTADEQNKYQMAEQLQQAKYTEIRKNELMMRDKLNAAPIFDQQLLIAKSHTAKLYANQNDQAQSQSRYNSHGGAGYERQTNAMALPEIHHRPATQDYTQTLAAMPSEAYEFAASVGAGQSDLYTSAATNSFQHQLNHQIIAAPAFAASTFAAAPALAGSSAWPVYRQAQFVPTQIIAARPPPPDMMAEADTVQTSISIALPQLRLQLPNWNTNNPVMYNH